MPNIPSYTIRKVLPSASSGMAPLSTNAARTQGEAIGASLVPFGDAVFQLGAVLHDAKVEEEGRQAEQDMQELMIADMEEQTSMPGAPIERISMEPDKGSPKQSWGTISTGLRKEQEQDPNNDLNEIGAAYQDVQPILQAASEPTSVQFPSIKTNFNQGAMSIYNRLSPAAKKRYGHSIIMQVGNHRLKSLSKTARDQSAYVQQKMPEWAAQAAAGDPTTRNYVWANTLSSYARSATPAKMAEWNEIFESEKSKIDMQNAFSVASSIADPAQRKAYTDKAFSAVMSDPRFTGPQATQDMRFDAIAAMVETGVSEEKIGQYINTIKDPTDKLDAKKFHKSALKVKQEQSDVNTDNLQNEVLTILFEHRNDSPQERFDKGEELANKLKNSGIEPTRYSTLLKSIEEFQTKPEKLNHNPVLSGKLQSEAENADSVKSKNDVLQKGIEAYNKGEIKDEELELISKSSEKSYETVIGQQKKTMVDDFRYIATKGYSTNDLKGWMESQIISSRASGTPVNTGELINKWTRAAQARQWIVNEYNSLLEEQIDRIEKKEGRDLTDKEIRTVGLSIQRFWLRKSDSQLVDLYDQWLQR